MSDWTAFGRVDADGTVYVKTAEGERVVGSWQAGHAGGGAGALRPPLRRPGHRGRPDRGPAQLRRRRRGALADQRHGGCAARSTRRTWSATSTALAARLDKLAGVAEEKAGEARAAREAARTEALARKTALVEEAEKLAAESTGWKTAGDRLKEILDEWKTIRGVDKKTDGELWKRFAAARDGFTRRRGAHFATLDAQRKQAQAAKEELVAEAETLSESTDWAATANRLKELMTRVEGRAARLEGGRAEAVGAVPGRAGRLLHPPQRGLLRPRRRAAGQPGAQAGAAGRGRGARRRRRPAGRAGQAARDPGAVARRRPGAARGGRRPGPPAAGRRGEGPPGDGLGLAAHRAVGEPAAGPDARAGGRGRAAAGPGPGGRATPSGSARPSRRWPPSASSSQLAEQAS